MSVLLVGTVFCIVAFIAELIVNCLYKVGGRNRILALGE